MRALALDVGSKTIGLALSDAEQIIATACETLRRRGHVADAVAVEQVVRDRQVGHVVVGLPLELDGREGRRARAVREFMTALSGRFEKSGLVIEVLAWDERFSTAAAERTLLEADTSRARRKQHIDAMAAQFILQGWLDSRGGPPA